MSVTDHGEENGPGRGVFQPGNISQIRVSPDSLPQWLLIAAAPGCKGSLWLAPLRVGRGRRQPLMAAPFLAAVPPTTEVSPIAEWRWQLKGRGNFPGSGGLASWLYRSIGEASSLRLPFGWKTDEQVKTLSPAVAWYCSPPKARVELSH